MAPDHRPCVRVDIEPRETGVIARVTVDNATRLNGSDAKDSAHQRW